MILRESYFLLRKAFLPLLDEAWDDKEVKELEDTLRVMHVNFHELRTRVAGNYRFVDLHVEIPKEQTVENAHNYCDMIEEKLIEKFKPVSVTIHVEPI